jgi:hypothetical protein
MESSGDLRGSWRTENPDRPVGTVLLVDRDGDRIRVRWFAEVPVSVVTADATGFVLSLSGSTIRVDHDRERDTLVLTPSNADGTLILTREPDPRFLQP